MLIIRSYQAHNTTTRHHSNELVYFRDNCNQPELSAYADMLLGQLNTAGGMRIQGEVENFLDSNPI